MEELSACMEDLLPVCILQRKKKILSDSIAANLILPGKRFVSVGRGREVTKKRHFLNIMTIKCTCACVEHSCLLQSTLILNLFTGCILKCFY